MDVRGGGYQANLSVKIADPNSPGGLDYGPLSYISCAAILALPNPVRSGPAYAPNTEISATFTPKYGYILGQAEKICGYFAFDWQQTATVTSRPQPSNFAAFSNPNVILYAPYNDPPISGWAYQTGIFGPPNAVKIPVFYNLYASGFGLSLDANETATTLTFDDSPAESLFAGRQWSVLQRADRRARQLSGLYDALGRDTRISAEPICLRHRPWI